VSAAGQLEIALNGAPAAATVVGRATGTDQIAGDTIITTNATNVVLSILNPAGNPTDLVITPDAGGSQAASATLLIRRLA
jgi:hypothetical protein